ncbi:L-aspartate oxidase [candidate division KSB1 bacterium]|nr:L-aspartate oxidase [candidate division KSB1 bacterium]
MNHHSDFLVIGSGIAGLSFALQVADQGSVIILTKKERADSNTNRAQGGIAAVFGNDDSFDLHVQDTLKAGVGLCHTDAVEQIVREGPESIRMLQDWGVDFTHIQPKSPSLDLGREGGHTRNRIIHSKDRTGMAVEHALLENLRSHPNIQMLENQSAIELITEHHLPNTRETTGLHCWGVYAVDGKTGDAHIFSAHVTVLATGGAGWVYPHTTNPDIATGDGVAMAYRAGVPVANLEFLQFHPTSLYHPQGDSFLISEAVRGFGGILRTGDGEAFMTQYDKQADLAPRDIVARAIDSEMKRRGDECVYLDVTHLDSDKVRDHFPTIHEKLLSLDIDMTQQLIPVVPAAHYLCGGVITDLAGKTVIQGLYVTGEAACTGVHGANRLASNSLLEALVFSNRASQSAIQDLHHYQKSGSRIPDIPEWNIEGTFDQEEWVLISHDLREIQRLMWDYVGIVRSSERLKRAWRRVGVINRDIETFYRKTRVSPQLLELRNISCTASLIIRSALFRKESRGLHYTTDFPDRDDQNWLGDTVIWGSNIFLRPLGESLQQPETEQTM